MAAEEQKAQAAVKAVAHVRSGMTVGLGSGSTARHAILELGRRLAAGELRDVRGVPTSEASAALALAQAIPLVALGTAGVAVAIDGVDELTESCDAIKGLGGALTREKIVAARAGLFILIGDGSKLVNALGERAPLPVEVVRFGWRAAQADLSKLGCEVVLRLQDGAPFVTDNGHFILDCHFGDAMPAPLLAAEIPRVPGVIEHGLFLGMAHLAYLATATGVRELRR